MTEAEFIETYLDAFRLANPFSTVPTVTYERGWFVFRHEPYLNTKGYNKRYRRATMDQMLDNLRQRIVDPEPSRRWLVI